MALVECANVQIEHINNVCVNFWYPDCIPVSSFDADLIFELRKRFKSLPCRDP